VTDRFGHLLFDLRLIAVPSQNVFIAGTAITDSGTRARPRGQAVSAVFLGDGLLPVDGLLARLDPNRTENRVNGRAARGRTDRLRIRDPVDALALKDVPVRRQKLTLTLESASAVRR